VKRCGRTTKGLLAMARMLRSFLTLCTMFLRIRSALRITLMANRSPVAFFLAYRRALHLSNHGARAAHHMKCPSLALPVSAWDIGESHPEGRRPNSSGPAAALRDITQCSYTCRGFAAPH